MDKTEIIKIIGNTTIPLANLKDYFNIDDYINFKEYVKKLENKGLENKGKDTVISYGVNVRLSSDAKDTILPFNYNPRKFNAEEVAKQVSDGYKIPDFMTNLVKYFCKDVFFRADYSKEGDEIKIKRIEIKKITSTDHMVFDNKTDLLYKSTITKGAILSNIANTLHDFFSINKENQNKGEIKTFLHENIRGLYPNNISDEKLYVWVRGEDPDILSLESNIDYLTNIFAISKNYDIIENIRKNYLESILEFVMLLKSRRTLDYNIIQNRESIKSSKAAIMSRNMSHNLGSHVMFYIKQKLESVNNIYKEGALVKLLQKGSVEDLKKHLEQNNAISIGDEMPFLVGLGRFINYLQERQDYIATIATDYIPYKSSINFKDAIYDELKPDLRFLRHKEDPSIKGKQPDNLLLEYIAYSEGFKDSEQIELLFEDFDGTGTPLQVPQKLRQFNIALPGGNLGRQAFFSIMENIIRNTAKHDGTNMAAGSKLKFRFDLIEFDNNDKDDKLALLEWTNRGIYPTESNIT